MSSVHPKSSPSLSVHWPSQSAQTQSADDHHHIVYSRQLWQRNMPDGNRGDHVVLNRSQAQNFPMEGQYHLTATNSARHISSPVSSRSQRRSPSPSRAGSKTPLTPEESPPSSRTRKRDAGTIEEEEKEFDGSGTTTFHTRQDSCDSGIHVCICQPNPKIPRPRNAFILYRQHHQANVVAQNPGLANPEISKIIGEQWQNQPPEVKNKWKALAEEEKIRHQQQYPTYRYQPKRSARRGSLSSDATGEKAKCTKCGGRSILTPSTPYHPQASSSPSPASEPRTPSSAITPVSRTLPALRDLSVQSPAARRPSKHNMPSGHNAHQDDRDEAGPLSPNSKRRRFNRDHQPILTRIVGPRYSHAPPGTTPIGPGTPFPFNQPPPHPYPLTAGHARRESLPGLRGIVSPPGPMPPPPRPGPGYQQHRLSQGHVPHDRSLTLPPLQTGAVAAADGVAGTVATAGVGKTAKEQIMSMDFRHKIHVLRRVAPPAPVKKKALRGPLVVIEGDNFEAVTDLGFWLSDMLHKDDDLKIELLKCSPFSREGAKEEMMAQCHELAAEWLAKSREIKQSLAMPPDSSSTPKSAANSREIDENYEDSEDASSNQRQGNPKTEQSRRTNSDPEGTEEVDTSSPTSHTTRSSSSFTGKGTTVADTDLPKPVCIISNYSLHASNFFACHIPIDAHDPYAPSDHWQWMATQWRGIVPPDLTIYVRDADADAGKQSVDILDEGSLFVIRRTTASGREKLDVEPSTLRRLGFEVSEWVRAFGGKAD